MANQTPTVDEHLDALDLPLRSSIDAVRRAILGSTDGLTEHIKWNAPSYVADGEDRVTFRFPPKGGIQLVLHRGVRVRDDTADFTFDDESGLIEWITPDRGTVTLADAADVEAKLPAISTLVRRWVRV